MPDIQSAKSEIEDWLLEVLARGNVRKGVDWDYYIGCRDIYDCYLERCKLCGSRHLLSPISFGLRLRQLLPGIKRVQRNKNWHYIMPNLDTARDNFSKLLRYPIDWADAKAFVTQEKDRA